MELYNVFVVTPHGIFNHCISSDKDLIDEYKSAQLKGEGFLIWDDGIFKMMNIVGISRNPRPKQPKAVT